MVDLWFFFFGFDWLFAYCFEKDRKILTYVEVTLAQVIYKPWCLAVLLPRVWLLQEVVSK